MQPSNAASEMPAAHAFSGSTLIPAALFTARSMVSVVNVISRYGKAPVSPLASEISRRWLWASPQTLPRTTWESPSTGRGYLSSLPSSSSSLLATGPVL
eukprot:s2166_g7.t1